MSGMLGPALRMVVSLAIVLALMYIAARLLQRIRGGAPARPASRRFAAVAAVTSSMKKTKVGRRASRRRVQLDVIARQPLGKSASVAVVRVGDRTMLIGVTDANVQLLSEVDAALFDEAESTCGTRGVGGGRAGADARFALRGVGHGPVARAHGSAGLTFMADAAARESRRSWFGRALLLLICAAMGLIALMMRPVDASAAQPVARQMAHVAAVRADSTPAPITPIQPIAPIAVPSAQPSGAASSGSTTTPTGPTVTTPTGPTGPAKPAGPQGTVSVSINGVNGKPSQSVVIILMMTVISIAPAALMLCTSFTKIIVVLSLTRNALGLQSVPPNQVLVGLALFLSLFIMGPTLSSVNKDGVQPYLHNQMTASQAYDAGVQPLKQFMLKQTRKADLASMVSASKEKKPATQADVSMTTLVPAFILSELRAAFIIGFVIFIPFLVIDLVVSSSLMSMGMMMLPPSMISLPFKLLLFVMVDGWGLIAHALVTSYH